ncbi:putative zinc-binding metallopeptidase [Falsirhodobacter algicola]|uniref:Zinc-ribbon domain-containing protein n=1 Tax=Falsirhodobacter algicola TaxID=2692330 RepID=A0A8J8MUR0_9RHOB|nr:putative zinc-binding metallopeptidase [Falsirhodobacter algicola]QUS36817.1 hypothetical protein GR316_11405 [Falsirhodobacter algicola]
MKRFSCPVCRNRTHFRNTQCLACGAQLAFDPATRAMVERGDRAACANRDLIACNWLAPQDGALCVCCADTKVIPDLSVPGNLERWTVVETAKRRLYDTLNALHLPRISPSGKALRFCFMGDEIAPDGSVVHKVMTGHMEGEITLNIAEADDDEREARRVAMGEPLRTLLGHLRHEVGHYYWEVLVREAGREAECARIFGDARQDYAAALQRHYTEGPPADWREAFISEYATAHPWEDWAETWAHLLHIIDGLDTARHYGLDPSGMGFDDAHDLPDIDTLMAAWVPLSTAMNAMNRSMGHNDFYPFAPSPAVTRKMGYMLQLIRDAAPLGVEAPEQSRHHGTKVG